ncbi:Hypothetical protein D9617_10g073930 [Elsinoe fawcettii]|nr:Hypothetical protein D9617_10g073930 [Elsinoe fawcettii]
MAMPSSPPLLPEDLPSSPPLPPVASFRPRKRPFFDDDNLSSDPVFSEDISDVDERPGSRRKRLYKGPWWASSNHAQRKSSKFADSGVWLASESSDDGFALAAPRDVPSKVANDVFVRAETSVALGLSDMDIRRQRTLPTASQLAAQIVLDCVEHSREVVDLSDMALKELPDIAISPLRQLIRARDMESPDSDNFMPLTPNLQIFLSGNALRSLPNELWRLENTTVLSLRNNDLSELPDLVGQLKRLTELNLAGNDLHWLPWELLNLIRLRQGQVMRLVTHPNPLWLPVEAVVLGEQPPLSFVDPAATLAIHRFENTKDGPPRLHAQRTLSGMISRVASTWLHRQQVRGSGQPNMTPVFGAASTVRYFDMSGNILRQYARLPTAASPEAWPADLNSRPDPSLPASNSPSLFELAARGLGKHYPEHIPSLVAQAGWSSPVQTTLQTLKQHRTSRLPTCSVCRREYLFKRAEWVEYWHCNMNDSTVPSHLLFLPFMRRACSWGCVRAVWAERSLVDHADCTP